MSLSWKIARKYLFAKKSHHLINVISLVSIIGVGVSTMGLIIVLSVFNGFGNLVLSLYDSFDPDIKITAVKGKTFHPEAASLGIVKKIKGIEAITKCIEENALLKYNDKQYVATLKGVDTAFFVTSGIQDKIVAGDPIIESNGTPFMIVGGQIAYALGIRPNDPLHRINITMPRKGIDPANALLDPNSAFIQRTINVAGVFSIQQDFDSKYALVPIALMRELTENEEQVSALEIKVLPNTDSEELKIVLKNIVGNKFEVKDRLEQHDFLYKILKSEKAAVYLILGFILLISAFNLFGTLTILIVDKRNDIITLSNLGADLSLIKKIFLIEGLLISLSGAIAGLIIGAIICLLQQQFGFIHLENAEGFVTDAYPVAMQLTDFFFVITIVFVIGFSAAWFTSQQIVKRQLPKTRLS
jgi:lipoprotein-releasing system permease protein